MKSLKKSCNRYFRFKVLEQELSKTVINNARNYLIIDQRTQNGIEKEMGVISSDGIIGIVNQITANFSSVISILHRDLKINTGFKKNGAYGSLSWTREPP